MRKALERLVKVTKEFMDANKAEVDLLRSRVKELSEENKRLKREIFKYKINGR